jgi:hypothetical protein
VCLHTKQDGRLVKKYYSYPDEFIPGSTSGSGEVTAEVVYVGYGITAPELNYDDYAGVDVKGRIVLVEREVPVSDEADPNNFLKWRRYSYHQYKIKNAVAHGAAGMLYNYGPVANPNNAYAKFFIYSHIGLVVANDIFSGTGRLFDKTISEIKKTLQPQSFATGKIVTIKNVTEYHLKGIGRNVLALLEGCDPNLKSEVFVISGHLDHLGKCYTLMPGANDNASAVAVMMEVAEALKVSPVKPRRSVLFACFGAEEQGVAGSEYFIEHPSVPLDKIVGAINMDSVGAGDKLAARAAKNYPKLWKIINESNQRYVHQVLRPGYFANIARPRIDASWFMWKQIPIITFKAFGGSEIYHVPKDTLEIINAETLENVARLLFLTTLDITTKEVVNFKTGAIMPLFIPAKEVGEE